MLTRWLTLTAVLAHSVLGGAATSRGVVTFAPSCRVKGHPEVEITLSCGDGENEGVVQYWHTPFGGLETPGFHPNLEPVFMDHDGSLVIPNSSILHSGLYYCLLQGVNGATLWQYELHVDPDHHQQEKYINCAAFRLRRADSLAEKQAGVSDGLFAGAVAASVMLTFVVGFSAGALSRTHVLRCFRAVTERLQPRQADMPDHGSHVTMTTIPSTYNNQAFELGSDSSCATSVSLSPPAKPQRSFRHKREEEEEATAYLEGCDPMEEEEEGDAAGGVEEITGVCDDESTERELNLSEDGGNQTNTNEDTQRDMEEEEEGEAERFGKEDGDEARRDEDGEKKEAVREEDERSSKTSDDITDTPPSAPIRGRRSRVIRLYQYDEDGQRFGHLPDPAPEDKSPAPKLKQRSISLTRLSAIMAAAASGPLEQKEADAAESEERLQFHMEI